MDNMVHFDLPNNDDLTEEIERRFPSPTRKPQRIKKLSKAVKRAGEARFAAQKLRARLSAVQ